MGKFHSNTRSIVNRWLDDERAGKGKKKLPKRSHVDAQWLKPEEANGTVVSVYHKQCRVEMDETKQSLLCNYRRQKVHIAHEDGHRERSPVAVGDRVKVVPVGQTDGVVEGVSKRKNMLTRPAPGKELAKPAKGNSASTGEWIHVLAANLDFLIIVASAKNPEFSPGFVDRFLICAKRAGIKPILCINKIDLMDAEESEKLWLNYAQVAAFYGLQTFEISVKKLEGIEQLLSSIKGSTSVLCGHSGVGKTSLLRKIIGQDVGELGDTNAFTGKGKHTTTSSSLFHGINEIKIIDTPGIRALGLHGMKPNELKTYFPEFEAFECENKLCTHLEHEEGCKLKENPERLLRYESYLRIYDSLTAGEG